MNLQEDYCSFELSKLLKEKGFDGYDWCCSHVYTSWQMLINGIPINDDDFTYAPTHQMAMKWLRENEIYITIKPFKLDGKIVYTIVYLIGAKDDESMFVFDTYEEAVEAALKYVLENLISTPSSSSEFSNYCKEGGEE